MSLQLIFLYSFTALLVLWIGIKILRKNFRSPIHQSFSFFSLGIFLWVVSLFGNFWFEQPQTKNIALFCTRLTYGFGLVSLGFAIRYVYLYPRETFRFASILKRGFLLILVAIALFSSFTPYVYEAYISGKDQFGQFYALFVVSFCGGLILLYSLLHMKARSLQGIEKKRIQMIRLGAYVTSIPVLFSHVIFPLFGIYALQAEIVFCILAFSLSVLYGMQKYRFMDIKLNLINVLKASIACVPTLAVMVTSFFLCLSMRVPFWGSFILSSILGIILYPYFLKLLNSDTFYGFFGVTDGEYFVRKLKDFRSKAIIYKTISELRKLLRELFCQKLKVSSAELIILNKSNKKTYFWLIQYFEQNNDILIKKEIPYRTELMHSPLHVLDNFQPQGEVFLPIYHPRNRNLIGFFILGSKLFDDLYSKEEIQAIEELKTYLSLQLTPLLYQHDLQRAIKVKTHQLDHKYEVEQEIGSTLAHEIKTPLTKVTNANSLLLESLKGWRGNIPSDIVEKIQELSLAEKRELYDLKQISENLLLMREVELQKKALLHEFDPTYQFENVIDRYRMKAQEKGLYYRTEIDLVNKKVYGAGVQFEQVIAILLDNAVKYTKKGSVTLTLKQTQKKIEGMVTDTGVGIEERNRKAIFERFYRDRNERNDHLSGIPGLGVGLYIAGKIMKYVKGKMVVKDNVKGNGTMFIVELPIYYEVFKPKKKVMSKK